jgi:uncharacterized YigZ family protein
MLIEDTYKIIVADTKGIFKEKGSKFIAYSFHVMDENEVKEKLLQVKKMEYSARHFCYAYVLKPDKSTHRVNDDGEPANTAGKPILGQIQSNNLTNILIVVVRYFGGVKLGVGGLINAYRSAAAESLLNTPTKEKFVEDVYNVKFEYPQMNDVMRLVKDLNLNVIKQDFQISCLLQFSVRKSQSNNVVAAFKLNHKLVIEYKKTI